METVDPPRARRIERVTRPFATTLELPGSKSIALRHVLISALAEAPTRLSGIPRCDDVDAMFDAVARLGAGVERRGGGARMTPAPATDARLELDLGMSGVSLRLLLGAAMLRQAETRFTGHAQLRRRPNADLLAALAAVGCRVESNDGFLPIAVRGPAEAAAETTLRTGASSQFLSALLIAAPRLPQGLLIRLEDERASASYVRLTKAEMAKRGAGAQAKGDDAIFVPPARYRGGDVAIEGDASAATYHAALATLHGGAATFANLGGATLQGDYGFLALCERMGAAVERDGAATVVRGPRRLAPVGEVDMSDMPDAAPTLMALAPFLPAPTRVTGLATLRIKECDRLAAGARELRKTGASVAEEESAITIHPLAEPKAAVFDTYEDHRMAMALSVLASGIGGCVVKDAGCVRKTYADYWRDFDRIY